VGFWLDYPFDFASGIILQSVSRLSSVFSFLPAGAIGFQEALTGLGATGLGQAAVSGVMISTVDRIVGVAWLLVAGSIGLFVVRSRIADAVETVVSTKSNAGRA
jgi:hypothetical protein